MCAEMLLISEEIKEISPSNSQVKSVSACAPDHQAQLFPACGSNGSAKFPRAEVKPRACSTYDKHCPWAKSEYLPKEQDVCNGI